MPNARELGAEELVGHLHNRALQTQRAFSKRRVIANLAQYPHLAPIIDSHMLHVLQGEGLPSIVIHKKAAAPKSVAKKKKPPAEDKTSSDGDTDGRDACTGGGEGGDNGGVVQMVTKRRRFSDDLNAMIDSNPYRKLIDWPVKALSEVCTAVNRIAMSETHMKEHTARGKRRENQEKLCKCIELSTGLDGTYAPKKSFDSAEDFMDFLISESKQRGCRGESFDISAVDGDNIIFGLKLVGKNVSVMQKFTGAELLVPSMYSSTWDIAKMKIENGHSERSAVLSSSKAGSKRFQIFFESHILPKFVVAQGVEAKLATGGEMIEDVAAASRRPTKRARTEAIALVSTQAPQASKDDVASELVPSKPVPTVCKELAKLFTASSKAMGKQEPDNNRGDQKNKIRGVHADESEPLHGKGQKLRNDMTLRPPPPKRNPKA
jgi:hypothetical protein